MSDDYEGLIDDEPLYMRPVQTPKTNKDIGGGHLGIPDLPAEITRDGDGHKAAFATYGLSTVQLDMLAKGARIRLGLHALPIPPVSVRIEGPFCPQDEVECIFGIVEDGGPAWFCPDCGQHPDDAPA